MLKQNSLSGVLAQILVEGQRVGSLDRNGPQSVVLSDAADKIARAHDGANVTMDILIEAVGRVNTGTEYDLKGLIDPLVLLNSEGPCSSALLKHPLHHTLSLLRLFALSARPQSTPAKQDMSSLGTEVRLSLLRVMRD